MIETDLSDYFQQLCQQSEWSLHKIQDAVQSNWSQPQKNAPAAKHKASETTGDRKRTDTAQDKAWGRWQAFRDQWRTHVAKVRADTDTKLAELDATGAAHYAEEAESDAHYAIGHALGGL